MDKSHLIVEKLQNITSSLSFVLPELWLTAMLLVIILIDLLPLKKNFLWLTILSLLAVFGDFVLLQIPVVGEDLFVNLIRNTTSSILIKKLLVLSGFIFIVFRYLSNHKSSEKSQTTQGVALTGDGEYYILALSVLLGGQILVMSNHWLILVLAIELISMPSYLMTAFKFNKFSFEASVKYLLFGALATAIMLYGISVVYMSTGSLYMDQISWEHDLMCSIGLLLTIGGLLFKLSAVPFHFWAPDVYQGAPTDAVAFFTVAPKTAAIGFLAMFLVQIHWIDHPLLVKMILISAVASIVLGNLAALWQKNVKRMLAYSSIANAGYILLALLSVQGEEISIIVYYLFVYLCANFTIFFVVKWLERELKQEITFSQFDGLGYKSLWLGIFVTLSMISLAGLPPLAGFTAKLLIFGGVWSFYQVTQELYILIIMLIAVVNTVIGLVYYIRIPYALYFKKSSRNIGALSISGYVFIFMLSIQLLILFFTPNIYHFFE